MPFPVTDYEATMVVSDDGGSGRLSWSARFAPDEGASGDEIARNIQRRFGAMLRRIEAHLKKAEPRP